MRELLQVEGQVRHRHADLGGQDTGRQTVDAGLHEGANDAQAVLLAEGREG